MRLVRGYADWCDRCSIFKKFLKQVCYILKKDIIYVSETYLQIPPPVSSPSLIEDSALSLTVFIYFFGCISHLLTRGWVSDKLANTFHWVPLPEMKYLCPKFSLLILFVSYNLEWLTRPTGTAWENVHGFVLLRVWVFFLDIWFC